MTTEENIVALLQVNNDAVERAVLAIFARQTEDEKRIKETKHSNQMGFSSADARNGSYYAGWIKSNRKLSGKFLDKAREMMVKYRRQLLIVSVEKAIAKDPILSNLWCRAKESRIEFGELRLDDGDYAVLDDALIEKGFTKGINLLLYFKKHTSKKEK